mgnify:CR=1 FL=1|tara:strand:+ start:83 stop:340 length:258 start_codon:yes stop_codon:yes gene_type:complete
MREIYTIIDTQNKDAYCSTTPYQNRSGAQKVVNRMMKAHVRQIMKTVQKMTGTVRGKNVEKFNEAVESVANPRYIIESTRLNTDW